MVKTFNADLRDFLLKKAHYIQRLENGTLKEMIEPYKKARKTIKERIVNLESRLDDSSFIQVQIDRLNREVAEIDNVLKIASIESSKILDEVREEVAILERDALTKKLAAAYTKIGVDIVQLPYNQINFILSNPLFGESIGDKLLWMEAEAVRKIKQELTQSLIIGEDIKRATKRLLGVGDAFGGDIGNKILNRATMIARSEIMYVSNMVNKSVFDYNLDVIKGLEYVATLDRRTCEKCGPLDGKIYYYNKDGSISNFKQLPQHPLCRCIYAPATYSWTELAQKQGIEIKNQTQKDYFSGWEEKPYTYNDWLKDQEESFQLDVLGNSKYNKWVDGDIEFDSMPIQTKTLTVEEYSNILNVL